MLKHHSLTLILFSIAIIISGCEKDPLSKKGQVHLPDKSISVKETPVLEKKILPAITQIDWEDLIPDEWRPDPKLVDKYNSGEIGDDDPRIMALKDRLRELEKRAPVNEKLDGKIIKMPGFVVPVETDGKIVHEFLLVPYHGACVHVPPPPANQTVYIKTNHESAGKFEYFDTVWVTGLLTVKNTKSIVAESGYTIMATKVELYK